MATTDYNLAHTLPANVEAERSILGAILLDNLAYNEAAEHLKPEDFSLDSHRRIFTRMVDLAESSRPIDMITLVEELDRRKELEAILGAKIFLELYVKVLKNWRENPQIVRQLDWHWQLDQMAGEK